jgi:hypothetical protein
LTVRTSTSQTADIQQWMNQDASVMARVDIYGSFNTVTSFTSAYGHYQALFLPSGGAFARSGHFTEFIHLGAKPGNPTATGGMSVPADGIFHYDSTLGKFRAYENGVWKDMIGLSGADLFIENTQGDQNAQFRIDGFQNVLYMVAQPSTATAVSLAFQTGPAGGGATTAMTIGSTGHVSIGVWPADHGAMLNLTGQFIQQGNVNQVQHASPPNGFPPLALAPRRGSSWAARSVSCRLEPTPTNRTRG